MIQQFITETIAQLAEWVKFNFKLNLIIMKISNVILSTMISASFLVCIESNAQKIKKPISEIKKTKRDSLRKIVLSRKQKQDSIKTIRNLVIRDIDKYCPGCGKG